MQEKTEDIVTFKTLKERLHDWELRHLWPARLFEYFLLSLLVSVIGAIFFKLFDLFQTDADSARYMLSALVQSQAAIIAIVVSLTLIAVQLTASAYSPRVIRLFLKTPDMWLLLGLYGFSIAYGLLVLKLIRSEDLRGISLFGYSLEYHIVCVYLYGGLTFIGLFLYTWNIINFLNPSTIINRLAIGITKDTLLNSEEDPIQPIMDIVHGSIMKYDIATTRVGLKAVTDKVIKIIDSKTEKEISELFCNHLERVGKLAISSDDVESTEEVIKNLTKFGVSTMEKGLAGAASTAVEVIETAGVTALKKDFAASWQAVDSLEAVGEVAAVKGHNDVAVYVARNLTNFGLSALEKDEGIINKIVWTIEDVGKKFEEYELEKALKQAAWALLELGKAAREKGLEKALKQAAQSLAGLTLSAEEIVKTAIQEYESMLKEQERASFQQFKELYEQELEKLRAEKKDAV
jgi:hypothetical protein